MSNETKIYLSVEEAIRKTLLMNESGHFELYGAHVCFFKIKGADRVQVFFPFKVFEFQDKVIADDPLAVAMKLCGYIQDMKSCGIERGI